LTNRVNTAKDLQFQLVADAAHGPRAKDVASRGRVDGPASIVLDSLSGGQKYTAKIWDKSRVPHTYLREVRPRFISHAYQASLWLIRIQCTFTAPFIGPQTVDWYTNFGPMSGSEGSGPLNMGCGVEDLDPESGPYITIYPDGVKVQMIKPALQIFEGVTYGSFD
jgi:hypothetical protein